MDLKNFKIKLFKNHTSTSMGEKEQKLINLIITSIGSMKSLLIHTILFGGSFLLYFLGYNMDKILLVLTTMVSLEAIYLSILIQMSVNIQSRITQEIREDVGEIQKDVEDIQENVEEIQENVEELQPSIQKIL